MILTPVEQRIKAKIEAVGTPLKDWDINIYRGILTGYNEAFIVDGKKKNELIAADPKSAEIIRPILRGRDIKRYVFDFADLWLINTHNGIKEKDIKPIEINDYPAIKKHLDNFYSYLVSRSDKGYTPYNLRNCAYMEDFSKQKIVWADLARTGNAFTYDASNSFLLNTCYILTLPNEDDTTLKFILGVLNSKMVLFYMNLISSKLDETGWRWFKQFVEILPIPSDKNKFSEIAALTELLITTKTNQQKMKDYEKDLNFLIYKLFELSNEEIEFIDSMNWISSLSKP
jgi:adenine-specific DNA-methyltransferase